MSRTNNTPARRYTEEEIERILARASELDAEAPPSSREAGGMTLVELEQIGAEAGLRPELLRKAARELDDGTPPSNSGTKALLGAPSAIRYEREVDGELATGRLEGLIPLIRRAADGNGHPAVVGNTLSWESSDSQDLRHLGITVTSVGGRTRIWIEERLGRLAGSLFGGIVGGFGGGVGFGVGMGVGFGALGSGVFGVTFSLALLIGSYLVARGIFRGRFEDRRRTLERLMEGIVAEVGQGDTSTPI